MKLVYLLILLVVLVGCNDGVPIDDKLVCEVDDDCVAAACCHPDSCVNKEFKPDCMQTICTMDCKPGTMDCGQGSCVCENSKCTVKIN